MNLDEAIKWLEEDLTNQHPYTPERVNEAKKLGIAALKYVILDRRYQAAKWTLTKGTSELRTAE